MIEPAAEPLVEVGVQPRPQLAPELRGGFRSIGHKRDHACPWGHSDSGRSARRGSRLRPSSSPHGWSRTSPSGRSPPGIPSGPGSSPTSTASPPSTSYEDLLADPEIDAIYNPLPNSLHAPWTLKAIDAGKHVLCEKPFTSNAAEAQTVAGAASSDRVVVEAFHYRYPPLATRMREVIDDGALGHVSHIETSMVIPLPMPGDIRYQLDLAGGACMDTGCYAIHMLRFLSGAEPEVTAARAKLLRPGVDRWMQADMSFDDGRTGRITCALLSARLLKVGVRVTGDEGVMTVLNPTAPQFYHRLRVKAGRSWTERLKGDATYTHQLRAFARAVLNDEPTITPPEDAVLNMKVIDAVYEAAGLEPRPVHAA